MGHSYNANVYTSSKGLVVEAVRQLIGAAGAVSTVFQGGSGLIASSAHTATGRYTFTLSVPYPPKLIACIASVSAASATAAVLVARYVNASYSASAGTFEIDVSNSDGSPIATDPASGDEIHLLLTFSRYNTIA